MQGDAYRALAPFYNTLMEHVDYAHWASFVHLFVISQEIPKERVLEMGAGTGNLAAHLKKHLPSTYILSDLSWEMLEHASNEFPRVTHDMRAVPFKSGSFDFVFTLYDAFNYLLNRRDVKATFAEAARVLAPGGYFLFDVITEEMCEDYFDGEVSVDRQNGNYLLRETHYSKAERFQVNHFTMFEKTNAGTFSKRENKHTQKVWFLEEIHEMWNDEDWELILMTRDFTLDDDLEDALRVNFLLKRKG